MVSKNVQGFQFTRQDNGEVRLQHGEADVSISPAAWDGLVKELAAVKPAPKEEAGKPAKAPKPE